MKPSEILRAAKPLLGLWCQHSLAVNAKGWACEAHDANAVARCIRGACIAAGIDKDWEEPGLGWRRDVRLNNNVKTRIEHVRGALDWAAQLAEDAGE